MRNAVAHSIMKKTSHIRHILFIHHILQPISVNNEVLFCFAHIFSAIHNFNAKQIFFMREHVVQTDNDILQWGSTIIEKVIASLRSYWM